jgi:protein-S-isoprenylcysteine O-methyltransferase Ste14
MTGKELAERSTDAKPLGFGKRSVGGIVLIFLLNLFGFWLLLPAALLALSFFIDGALSLKSLSIGPLLLSYLVAAAFLVSGLLLSLYSILIFAYFGDGMPIASLPPTQLVDKGPYSRSRHPIYLGYTVSLIGLGVFFGSAAFLFIVLPAFTLGWVAYAYLYEERVLGRRYGDSYGRYKQSAPLLFSIDSLRRGKETIKHSITFMVTSVIFKAVNRIFFDVEVTGDPTPRVESPIIVMANHANYLDPFIINAVAVGTYPLPRYSPVGIGVVRESLRMLQNRTSLAMFPEGERSWDARPLLLGDTVVRFLQKASVPIMVVSLSGNYNAWPRWARRPRRAKIRVHFHPPFVLSPNMSVEENKKFLSEKLRSPGKSYDEAIEVKGKNLVRGLPLLLWRCPLCMTNESLRVEKGNRLRCSECYSTWELTRNYHLNLLGGSSDQEFRGEKALSDWYALIKDLEELTPMAMKYDFLHDGERAYLESGQVKYSCLHGLKKDFSHRGRVVLTDRRLVFFDKGRLLFDELSEIGRVVVEGNNRVELGFNDRVISIGFKDESPLKWQVYISRARAGAGSSRAKATAAGSD